MNKYFKALDDLSRERLHHLIDGFLKKKTGFIGYPCSQDIDYSELSNLLKVVSNNIGDPWGDSSFSLNTHEMEREVLNFYIDALNAPKDNIWGYVTSGGTEGNMYGLYLAREIYPDGIVYFSEDTHYSVVKIIHILGINSMMIRSHENGEMDYEDLKAKIETHKDKPPIIFANIGTTMKQAVDDLDKIKAILGYFSIEDFYIHADAAFAGGYLPFVDNPPAFDFNAGIHSISISGHKFLGAPIPCGIALALHSNVQKIARSIEYIGSLDTTILGSRNAITPVILWYALKGYRGAEGIRAMANDCLETAEYGVKIMQQAGIHAWRHANSLTIVIPRPSDAVLRKWALAPNKDIAHIIVTNHVTKETLERLTDDLVEDYRIYNRQAAE